MQSGIFGTCTQRNWSVFYDNEMLKFKKVAKWNICTYRLIAPFILIVSLLGIKGVIEMVTRKW
jgi:hypothetical protein